MYSTKHSSSSKYSMKSKVNNVNMKVQYYRYRVVQRMLLFVNNLLYFEYTYVRCTSPTFAIRGNVLKCALLKMFFVSYFSLCQASHPGTLGFIFQSVWSIEQQAPQCDRLHIQYWRLHTAVCVLHRTVGCTM
jgi:hypothetical protein